MTIENQARAELAAGHQAVLAMHGYGEEFPRFFPCALDAWTAVHHGVRRAIDDYRSGSPFQEVQTGLPELVERVAENSAITASFGWDNAACPKAEGYLGKSLEKLDHERPSETNERAMGIVLDKDGQPIAIQKHVGIGTFYTFRSGVLRTMTEDVWVPENAFLIASWEGNLDHRPQEAFKGHGPQHAVMLESKKYWPTWVEFGRFSTGVFSPLVWKAFFDTKENALLAREPISPQFVEKRVQQLVDEGEVKRA